jgi:hypothetical protein
VSAVLKSAPSASAFAEAWAQRILRPALEIASGKDKKLSPGEAARAARSEEVAVALAGDTLEEIRKATGRKTPSLETMVTRGRTWAESSAAEVAGADLHVSFQDAKGLPSGLERGYLALRGRGASAPTTSSAPDLGVVSDIDKTVLPPHQGDNLPAPYPGVAALFRELDLAKDDELDATWYVTARSPERMAGIPEWLSDHSLPSMGISTGIGSQPWIAEPQKVQDILQIFDAHPEQKFVLFGDTSHRDPEVYKKVKAARPDQVAAVVIHKVNDEVSPARVEGMHLVSSYAEAAAELHHDGLLSKHAARKVISAARAAGLTLSAADGEALLAPR